MPFHIMYSFTMWKDVFWGALVTLFSVSIYSVIKIGNNRANIIIVIFSAIGILFTS